MGPSGLVGGMVPREGAEWTLMLLLWGPESRSNKGIGAGHGDRRD
jgi:hypothetical protein